MILSAVISLNSIVNTCFSSFPSISRFVISGTGDNFKYNDQIYVTANLDFYAQWVILEEDEDNIVIANMNVEGMLPFENQVADYVRRTGNHVMYRVTPDFRGVEMLARGVQMEAWSVEDNGEGVCFHMYCYNVQPGVEITYLTGESRRTEETGS